MRIAVASDRAGFSLKGKVLEHLFVLGHTVEGLGIWDRSPVDYPDFAEAVATAIRCKRVDRAVLLCGSGVDTYPAHRGVTGRTASPEARED